MGHLKERAARFINEWKGSACAFGLGCLDRTGSLAAEVGSRAVLFANRSSWLEREMVRIESSLEQAGVEVSFRGEGSRPNSPREDLYRMQDEVLSSGADLVVAVGGGSTIDAAKAAAVLAVLDGRGHDVEPYFGAGKVSAALKEKGGMLLPMVAVQCASGSAAHLTKYSNITDLETSQKKLISDEAIIPRRAVFDYSLTVSVPADLTVDGAFDGIAHIIEVYYGAGGGALEKVEGIARTGLELIVSGIGRAVDHPEDLKAREALGLGTDLGGFAIMTGSTNGGHLASFSLVDVLSHGRACAVMNPYYTVFFAPAVQRQLRVIGRMMERHGLAHDVEGLEGRDLGVAVAEGMMALAGQVGMPTRLADVEGFSDAHIRRALDAAKNPQLEMKLRGMPVPLSAEMVEDYMGPVLEAAKTGDLSLIRNVP